MRQRHLRRFSPRGRPTGYTLVEVVVAMLISCVMVTAVFGVALTSKQGSGEGMRRLLADEALAQISAQLKTYVTACCSPSTGDCPAPGCSSAGTGPNGLNPANGGWNFSGSAAGVVDCATAPPGCATQNKWALQCGNHYLTGINKTLEAAPYNGYFLYSVSAAGGGACAATPPVNGAPVVAFTANWTEP